MLTEGVFGILMEFLVASCDLVFSNFLLAIPTQNILGLRVTVVMRFCGIL